MRVSISALWRSLRSVRAQSILLPSGTDDCTSGYGDLSPETTAGRALFCFGALIGAGTLAVFFSVLAEAYSTRFSQSYHLSPSRDLADDESRENLSAKIDKSVGGATRMRLRHA